MADESSSHPAHRSLEHAPLPVVLKEASGISQWAFVALGSNVGERGAHLARARSFLASLADSSVVAASAVEETEPIGPRDQPPYLNQMVLLRTTLSPKALLRHCQQAEDQAGRVRRERWGPRTIDLDIVVFDDLKIDDEGLAIPHRELANRPFWLRALAELLPRTTADMPGAALPSWARVSAARRAHIERVAGLVHAWALAMDAPDGERRRWVKAAYLHDAMRDASEDELARLAGERWGVLSLYHGPAAARMAEEHGERDRGVLDAVRFHSVGYAGWDAAGRMLYLADYLEPGRKQRRAEREALAARVPHEREDVLRTVIRDRLLRAIDRRLPIQPETVEFWNAVVARAP